VCGAGNHHGGHIVAIDISPRMMRDFISLSEKRPGIVPVLGNARTPHSITPYLRGRAQWLFQDLSMPDQTTAFIEATRVLLESKGMGMIAIKAASERWTEGGDEALFSDAELKVRQSEHLELIERIDLSGLEEQHSVIVVRKL
jgi:fibrillarin-like rRNA methylase